MKMVVDENKYYLGQKIGDKIVFFSSFFRRYENCVHLIIHVG